MARFSISKKRLTNPISVFRLLAVFYQLDGGKTTSAQNVTSGSIVAAFKIRERQNVLIKGKAIKSNFDQT